MVEMILVLAISVFGFLFLFLALTLKNRPGNESTPIPAGQTCNCHKKELYQRQKTRTTKIRISEVKND
jgi:hypothetical protein